MFYGSWCINFLSENSRFITCLLNPEILLQHSLKCSSHQTNTRKII